MDCTRSSGGLRSTTPTSRSLNCLPTEKSAAKSWDGSNIENIENTGVSLTQPISARLGRKETEAVQRPKIGTAAVSEVGVPSRNPTATAGKQASDFAVGGVRNGGLAEGKVLKSNRLWRDAA